MSDVNQAQQYGVKETKELLIAMLAIAGLLAVEFKDGVQVADFNSIMLKVATNTELKTKIEAAYKDMELVKSETKEINFVEALELLKDAGPELLNLIQAIKQPKA